MTCVKIVPLELLKIARDVMSNAYCPYSKYQVGAALLGDNGMVVSGCNVENVSYGLSICAERVAFGTGISKGVRRFLAIAVVSSEKKLPYPCGACRQIMAEFCSPDFMIYIATSKSIKSFLSVKLGELLPHSFRL